MRVSRHRLWGHAAVALGLFVQAAAASSAAITPTPQQVTGTVQTVIRDQPRGRQDNASHVKESIKVLRVGTRIIPLTDDSIPTTKDGTKVSLKVASAPNGMKRVLSARTISAPAAPATPAPLTAPATPAPLAAPSTPAPAAPAITAPAAPAPPSNREIYLALVLPVGITADASITDASARAMVSQASRYWSSQTGGKVTFVTARVLPIYRSVYACGDTFNMVAEARALMPEASGPGKHVVLVAPKGSEALGCDYGLGTIGAVGAAGNAAFGSDLNEVFISGVSMILLAHELGHNMGLHHSNSLRCSRTQDLPMVNRAFPGCVAVEYDDLFDVMGYSTPTYGEGNLNAVHLDGMNLLPAAVRRIAANSGVTTARIAPLSTSTNNRTLKVTDPSGVNYFVEYRTNSGRDVFAVRNPWRPSWGVRVLRDDPRAPASAGSYVLDATPTSLANHDYNGSIPVGGTFTTASRKVTIKVTAASASGATVTITNWAAPIGPYKVTLAIPTRVWVGAAITAATKVTDRYGRASAGRTVTLQKVTRGTSTWRSVRTLKTTATGAASYRFTNGVSGYYRWVTASAAGVPKRFSPSVRVTSIARVAQRRPATSMTHGRYLSVSGSVSSVPSPVVYLQYRYRGGTWRIGPRATVRGTAVSGRIRLNARGVAYTRLYVKLATAYAGSVSRSYATTVR